MALALLAATVSATLLLIVAPILTAHREMASKIEVSRGLLNRYRALSAGQVQLAGRVEAVERTATYAGAYVRERSDAVAAATLREHVQDIVQRAGGELHASQVLPVEPVKEEVGVRRVSLNLQLAIEIGRLQDLIYDLETAAPFVFIRKVTIAIIGEPGHGGDAGADPTVDVKLQVYGFAQDVH
jgi:hypothetical protein